MKTITTMLLVVLTTTFAFAGKTGVAEAREMLREDIGMFFQKDFSDPDNYLVANRINLLKEDVQLTFFVNQERELVLVQVNSDNADAKDYIRYVFSNSQMKADKALCGQFYQLKLCLRFKAK